MKEGYLRNIIQIFILAIFLVCQSGCQTSSPVSENIFKYNQANGISSLDPAFSKDQATMWACNQIFDGLVRLDNDMQVIPAIASNWAVDPSGLHYTFNLRKDVFFHTHACFGELKTRKVTAFDFQYSFARILDSLVASPGAWIFKDRLNVQQPFEALDSFTLIIHLAKPFGPFLPLLTMQYCSVVPHEAITLYKKEFARNPVGTGPFAFKRWEDGIGLFLAKNNRYFLKDSKGKALPYLDGVKVSFMEQKKIEYLSFMNGSLDLLNGLDISYVNELLQPNGILHNKWKDQIVLHKASYLNTEYLGILQESDNHTIHPLLQNKLARQAMNYAINKKDLIAYLKNNIGKEANSGFVPIGLYSYDSLAVPGYSYNLEKARALMQRSGLNPRKLPAIGMHVNNANQDLAEFVAKQLEILGIKIEITLHPSDFLGQIVKEGKVDLFRRSWLADYADPETYLTCFYGKNSTPPNYTRFRHPQFDQWYEASLQETDSEKRKKLYQQMDRLILEEAPIIPLYYDEVVRFCRPQLKGLEPNSINLLDLREVKKLN